MSDHGNGLRPTGLSECTIGVENSRFGRRAPVQADIGPRPKHPAGTISWNEHLQAWNAYAAKYGTHQSAERIAERGGFGWGELVMFLGHEPTTWEVRK